MKIRWRRFLSELENDRHSQVFIQGSIGATFEISRRREFIETRNKRDKRETSKTKQDKQDKKITVVTSCHFKISNSGIDSQF